MFFNFPTKVRIARSLVLKKKSPLYVQFFVTARCNLTCKQCNIIYANAGIKEATTEEVDKIAENLKRIGTSIVLLTGGEPTVRKDIAENIRSFTSRGIHVRAQTNGLVSREKLEGMAAAGAHDMSISLDSLDEAKHDFLRGSHEGSWLRAMNGMARVTQVFPVRNSFSAIGTVLSPHNITEIPNIIRFATRIGWYVSLVPAHITTPEKPLNFRSCDKEMLFKPEMFDKVDKILDECIRLKKDGYYLYDSHEYINNIKRFIKGEPLTWRRKNKGLCDSPDLYFAIRPNGDIQVCCDHALGESYPVWHPDFPSWYRSGKIHKEVLKYTSTCSGCLYGSYPEISITAHYPMATLERIRVFGRTKHPHNWPLTEEQVLSIADEIKAENPIKNF